MRPDLRPRASWIPALVVVVALVLMLVAPWSMVRALAALFVAFLPGYLIIWPILRTRLGSAATFAISGGLSIGMAILAGLLLNLLPWGLHAASWLAYVGLLLAIAVALGWRPSVTRPTLGARSHELVLVALGGGLMVTALVVAQMFAAYPVESFTQLWIAPSASTPASKVEVGILNDERAATDVRLQVWRDGVLLKTFDAIHLRDGETWRKTVSVGSGRIEARLYRLADPGRPYRYVTLQLAGAQP